MVTKGIIVSVPESSDSNIYKVRLPFFEDPIENAEEMIYESTLNESPGILQGYEVGDVVYCTFEDNNMARPVIIGRLFSTLFENVAAEIETLDLDVTNRASLPKHTTIGNATEDDVARISEIKNKVNKMGDTIFGLMTFGNTIQFTAGKNINLLDSSGQITQTITADDLFGAAGDVSTKVSKSGDTMTGALTVQSTISSTSSITATGGSISASSGNVWAGTAGDTTAERDMGVRSGAGNLYLYSQASSTGNRGLYVDAHGTGSAKAIISIDTNNNATFNGNATSATSATSATKDGSNNTITSYYCTLSTAQTVSGKKTFTSEVAMTASGASDICSGVLAAFKTNRAQVTNLITNNIYTGGTSGQNPIIFNKYTAVSDQAPSTTVQLAKIDTDGTIYEGTTKLSDKYVEKSGSTMTGTLTLLANQYSDSYTGALNCNNSNIYGVNSIYTADSSDDSKEGIHFYNTATTVDTIYAKSGVLYFTPNRTLNSVGTSYKVYHSGNITYGTGTPSGGSDGDIYIQYTA